MCRSLSWKMFHQSVRLLLCLYISHQQLNDQSARACCVKDLNLSSIPTGSGRTETKEKKKQTYLSRKIFASCSAVRRASLLFCPELHARHTHTRTLARIQTITMPKLYPICQIYIQMRTCIHTFSQSSADPYGVDVPWSYIYVYIYHSSHRLGQLELAPVTGSSNPARINDCPLKNSRRISSYRLPCNVINLDVCNTGKRIHTSLDIRTAYFFPDFIIVAVTETLWITLF